MASEDLDVVGRLLEILRERNSEALGRLLTTGSAEAAKTALAFLDKGWPQSPEFVNFVQSALAHSNRTIRNAAIRAIERADMEQRDVIVEAFDSAYRQHVDAALHHEQVPPAKPYVPPSFLDAE